MSVQNYLEELQNLARETLSPLAKSIDEDAFYPKSFLQLYGQHQGFCAHGESAFNGLNYGIDAQIASIARLGQVCGSTAFNAWCQTACAWYIQHSSNDALKSRYLADVLSAKTLAGTGLSNTVKSLSGIEKHKLKATPVANGYQITGSLPWVTNIGEEHIFAATAETESGEHIMFIIEGGQKGVTLSDALKFCALNGTQTLSVKCESVTIAPSQLLASPDEFDEYLARIKSGFVMLQLGMALGVLRAAEDIMAKCNESSAELNSLLDYGVDDARTDIAYIEKETEALSKDILNEAQFLAVLKLRLYASEAALAASQGAVLHAGAAGYLAGHHAQRLNREAVFVAIITPSVKHLKREIHRLECLCAA